MSQTKMTFVAALPDHDNFYWGSFFFDQDYAESADVLTHTMGAVKADAKFTKPGTCTNAMSNEEEAQK